MRHMRALVAAMVVMGVLIVAGTVVLFVMMAQRFGTARSGQPSANYVLAEPAGSRIAGIAGVPGGLALWLTGGGPGRVVVVDPRSGRVVARVTLAK